MPKAKSETKCSVEGCDSLVDATTSQVTARIYSMYGDAPLECGTKESIGLCKKHYNCMYMSLVLLVLLVA